MAIIQISKIQHRRGLSTDLPQLASAELGWSIDTRQLYIGNGTIEEGAPTLGNTEILTEYSDILSVVQTYVFKGDEGGYIVKTGPSTSSPSNRTLQHKLDDFINVRDFGATGDGVTNDLAAINRALYEVYCRTPNNTLSRRTIYFPGGTYKITGGTVNIPTYAKIVGDGSNKTIIVQTDSTQDSVAKTADSAQQIGASIGQNSATLPTNIQVSGITFSIQAVKPVFRITTTTFIDFTDVVFSGGIGSPTTTSSTPAIFITALSSPSVLPSAGITFNRCGFLNCAYGMVINDSNVSDILFDNCLFFNLYQGVKLGELTAVDPRPTGVKIINSTFDRIYTSAISTYSATTGIYSVNNRYKDVGNTFLGSGNPAYPVIHYRDDECYSIGDQFDRPAADILDYPLIERGTTTGGPQGLSQGRQTIGSGTTATLADNTSSATTIASFTSTNAIIEYTITRGVGYVRTGILKLTPSGYDDEYQETASTGVTLSVTASTGVQSLKYVTTSTGTNAILTYTVKYFS